MKGESIMKLKTMRKKFRRYIRRTYKNKLCAIALFIIGVVPVFIENDGTLMIITSCISIPLFFSRKNHIINLD